VTLCLWPEYRMSENGRPIVQVEDLRNLFPIPSRVALRTVGYVKAVDGRHFSVQPGKDAGWSVEIRMRQDDGGADHAPAHPRRAEP